MLGFHAEYAGGDIVPQADEIEDAQWFNIHDLPPLPASRSIARYLIDLYVARRLGHAEPVLPGKAHRQAEHHGDKHRANEFGAAADSTAGAKERAAHH